MWLNGLKVLKELKRRKGNQRNIMISSTKWNERTKVTQRIIKTRGTHKTKEIEETARSKRTERTRRSKNTKGCQEIERNKRTRRA